VSRVRRKLGVVAGKESRIKTLQGIGYMLDVELPGAETGQARASASPMARDAAPVD
jgi:hypothetical protein